MRLTSVFLRQDGQYVALLDGDHGDDVSFVAKSINELHTMIHDSITSGPNRDEADRICDAFLESLVENAILKLDTLRANFGRFAA